MFNLSNEKALREIYKYLLCDPGDDFDLIGERNDLLVQEIKDAYKLSFTRWLYHLMVKLMKIFK